MQKLNIQRHEHANSLSCYTRNAQWTDFEQSLLNWLNGWTKCSEKRPSIFCWSTMLTATQISFRQWKCLINGGKYHIYERAHLYIYIYSLNFRHTQMKISVLLNNPHVLHCVCVCVWLNHRHVKRLETAQSINDKWFT